MRRLDLVADCARCAALCCEATSFEASADFAFDKPADVRCPHVRDDHRCGIHEDLAERGFRGCALYDCFGAGQKITRLFSSEPHRPRARNEAFRILREVHELLWLLTEAARLCPPSSDVAAEVTEQVRALDVVATAPANVMLATDLAPRRAAVSAVLRRVGDALGGRAALRGCARSRR